MATTSSVILPSANSSAKTYHRSGAQSDPAFPRGTILLRVAHRFSESPQRSCSLPSRRWPKAVTAPSSWLKNQARKPSHEALYRRGILTIASGRTVSCGPTTPRVLDRARACFAGSGRVNYDHDYRPISRRSRQTEGARVPGRSFQRSYVGDGRDGRPGRSSGGHGSLGDFVHGRGARFL